MSSAPQPSAQGRPGLWSRQGLRASVTMQGGAVTHVCPVPWPVGAMIGSPCWEVSALSTPQAPCGPLRARLFRPPQRTALGGSSRHYLSPTRPLVAPVASSQSPGRAGVMPAGPAWGSDHTALGARGQQLSWWEERWASLQTNPGFY